MAYKTTKVTKKDNLVYETPKTTAVTKKDNLVYEIPKTTAVTKKDNLVYEIPKLSDVLRASTQPSGERNITPAGVDPKTGRAIVQPGGVTKTATYEGGIMTRDAQGNLTDYGKSLENRNINYAGMDTPSGYTATKASYYGGVTPTYESYAGNAQAQGLAFADRATWEKMMQDQGKSYVSSGGQVVSGATSGDYMTSGGGGITNQRGMISQAKTTASNAIAEALKAKLAAIPSAYDPLRAQSEVQKQNELRAALEQSANLGDVGGIGRQQALETQTAGEQRLGQYNIAQQQDILNAQAQAAQSQADVERSALEQALSEQARIDQMNQQAKQFAESKAQQDYQYATSLEEQRKQREAEAKATAEALAYKREQDALQAQIDADTTEYNRARQEELDAWNKYIDAQNIQIKNNAQKLAEKKAKQAYETAKTRLNQAQQRLNKSKSGKGKKTGTTTGTGLEGLYS